MINKIRKIIEVVEIFFKRIDVKGFSNCCICKRYGHWCWYTYDNKRYCYDCAEQQSWWTVTEDVRQVKLFKKAKLFYNILTVCAFALLVSIVYQFINVIIN